MLGAAKKIVESDGDSSIDIALTATIYTHSIRIEQSEFFGLWVKAGSSPDLKIELEQGKDVPDTEGSSDTNWAVPEGISDIVTNLTATTAKIYSISPVPMPYMRLKITGNAGNGAAATLAAWLFEQSHTR